MARDEDDLPAVLLATSGLGSGDVTEPDISLERLSVRHGAVCEIIPPDGESREVSPVTVVRCLDPALSTHFLHVAESAVGMLGPSPSTGDVSDLVGRLVRLFRATAEPPAGAIQGLWAELLLIHDAEDVERLAEAWHSDPEERFDFVGTDARVEVKCTSGPARAHHFSLEQLHPPPAVEVVIASVLTSTAPGGYALADLLDGVRRLLRARRPELLLHVEQTVALTLGGALARGLSARFDVEWARSTLAYYPASAIPTVSPVLPSAVSRVRFVADLGACEPIRPPDVRLSHPLFHALPRTSAEA